MNDHEKRRMIRLKSIDIWRGVAALAVVAMHMRHDAPGGFREHPFFILWFFSEYGYLGVALFVVISGFCIHRASACVAARTGVQQLNWAAFWKRRFWRLYPTYIAAIVFTCVVSFWVYAKPVHEGSKFGWDLLSHLLLVHNLTDEFSTGLGNGVFWSLGMEEQLYGLYFFLFLLFSRGRYRVALSGVIAVAIAWRLAVPWMPDRGVGVGPFHLGSWYHWPFFYCLHWTLGALAVDASMGNIGLPRWCSSFRVACAWLVPGLFLNGVFIDLFGRTGPGHRLLPGVDVSSPAVLTVQYMGELLIAVSFFCLINWGIKMESGGRLSKYIVRTFAPIGRMSYSLYLVHVPVLLALEHWFPQPPTPLGWTIRLLTYWPVVLIVAGVFFRTVEKRFLYASHPDVAEPDRVITRVVPGGIATESAGSATMASDAP